MALLIPSSSKSFLLHQFNKIFYLFLNISFLCLLCFYLITVIQIHPPKPNSLSHQISIPSPILNENCSEIHIYTDPKAKCQYVKSDISCRSKGYIDYLQLFYCTCEVNPIFGYVLLILWIVLLFYLLANTAAKYFCSSLESLSKILKLSPTIAGVTLLSLGNGAPDVFSSIVSFMGNGNSGGVGFNSILGGAFVVSSVVVGVISISISPRCISVDKSSFIRDVFFFLFTLCSLLVIFIVGKIDVWASLAFVSLYFVYVFIVSTSHFCMKKDGELKLFVISPITRSLFGGGGQEFTTPLLGYVSGGDEEKPVLFEGNEQGGNQNSRRRICGYLVGRFLFILELPLYLPRRMTIPVVCEERWSKPFAVISVTLAPLLLVTLWDSQRENWDYGGSIVIYLSGGFMGIVFGTVAFVTTRNSNPPRRCLLPWLIGGFLMSVTWSYIIAQELVSLLISLGHIFGVSPSILGLTLLAWGNSLGDLIANVAMAMNGESDGAQIAISGCYAGPIFNTIVGLGFSLVFSSWAKYPEPYIIPSDPSLYETLGFLIAGLLWALVILPRKNMKLDKFLGIGLLAIYLCFLCVRLAQTTLTK